MTTNNNNTKKTAPAKLLDVAQTKEFNALLKDGANKDKLEGFMLYNGASKKDTLAYLKERGVIGKVSFRAWMIARCNEGFLSADSFLSQLEKVGTNNEKGHMKTFNNERMTYNAIHAKYDADIKLQVELETK